MSDTPLDPLIHRPQGDDRLANVQLPDQLHELAAADPQLGPLTPTGKLKVRNAIVDYCLQMERVQSIWHYSQARPMNGILGIAPAHGGYGDCSGYITAAFYFAMHVTGLFIPDPNALRWSGYGWTGSLCATNQQRPVPLNRVFFPGDIALYGSSCQTTHHGVICTGKGYRSTARWSSFGNEDAPERWDLS
jgi:hypothetical protein